MDIYNRIHLNILGINGPECESLISRANVLSKRITFTNNGNFEVKPEFFHMDDNA